MADLHTKWTDKSAQARMGEHRHLISRHYDPSQLYAINRPRINIVIPTYKSTTVATVIDAISREPFPPHAQVTLVVCANGARDETGKLAAEALVAFHKAVPNSTFVCTATEDAGETRALNHMVSLLEAEQDFRPELDF